MEGGGEIIPGEPVALAMEEAGLAEGNAQRRCRTTKKNT